MNVSRILLRNFLNVSIMRNTMMAQILNIVSIIINVIATSSDANYSQMLSQILSLLYKV
jgi:hypothetical protein